MLLLTRFSAMCTRVRCSSRSFAPVPLLVVLLPHTQTAWAAVAGPFPNAERMSGVISVCLLALLIAVATVSRARLRKAQQEGTKARELASYREQERNQAQHELLRRLEEERELAKEKMQFESQLAEYEKYASLSQLALGAAHEINNPLLGILSHLELEWRDASEEQRAEIDQCIEGTKRISNTLHRLMEYARPNPLLLSKVNLSRLVTETVQFLDHQPLFRQIDLENRVALDLPAITADANQLSQILVNLLLNAAQATPAGGQISISAQKLKVAEVVELKVRDTGCGIPADILPHVFEPFFTTKRGKGTGLGLSITQSYIRSHGGEIQIESVPGEGTSVRLTIPIRQAGSEAVQQSEEVVA